MKLLRIGRQFMFVILPHFEIILHRTCNVRGTPLTLPFLCLYITKMENNFRVQTGLKKKKKWLFHVLRTQCFLTTITRFIQESNSSTPPASNHVQEEWWDQRLNNYVFTLLGDIKCYFVSFKNRVDCGHPANPH